MKEFRLRINGFELHYDNSSLYTKAGWSICIGGHFRVELERWLVVAIWKSWKRGKCNEKY